MKIKPLTYGSLGHHKLNKENVIFEDWIAKTLDKRSEAHIIHQPVRSKQANLEVSE